MRLWGENGMNGRTLIGVWKANLPQWVWACLPFWIGSLIWALNGKTPQWGILALFLITVVMIQATAEIANTYIDRFEDQIYVPSNPLVTGELKESTARKALILENIMAGILLVVLLLISMNHLLVITMAVAWLVGLSYSLPPFKFKETIAGPFSFALTTALIPIAACLFAGPLNSFMIAFAAGLSAPTYQQAN